MMSMNRAILSGPRADDRQFAVGLRRLMNGAFSRLSILAACAGAAAIGPAAAGADNGKAKAEMCVACHGENGISATENVPSLASQPDLFLQWQLVFFRSGARKNETMEPIAGQLSNEDVRDLGAYFASLKGADASSAKAPDDHPELVKAGQQAAAAGRCASCHGDNYAGNKAAARIAGQREEYIVKALHDYKAGARTGGGVAAMAEVAYPLSDDDITALAHYLSRL
nr:c-type cytochrome [Bradyrhizobium brasilense]